MLSKAANWFAWGLLGALGCTARLDGPATTSPVTGGAGHAGGAAPTAGGVSVPATDPGRVTLHRLNRAEYDNTVRDLLGTSSRPAVDFPIDDRGSGFDNLADVLTLSPLHLSTYHAAARALVDEALNDAVRRAALVTCDLATQGEACVREVVRGFAYRAWRRPVAENELGRLLAAASTAVARGDDVEAGLALALRAVLLSPHFIFRVELDPDPTSLVAHPLTGYELATRLSYFLWSSTPDASLMARAESGTLGQEPVLREEVSRLLNDARSSALVDNFAGQWLHLRAIDALEPDPVTFAGFDRAVLPDLRRESELLFRDVMFGGAPLATLLTASYSYLNDPLARHYGLPLVGSTELVRVELGASEQRGGLLTQGGFLALTSYPGRTSPVIRGKWVMDELLCAAVPPPPADVDLGAVAMAEAQGLTQRQALERHRQDPKCIGCHQLMDPIGFGLENYDAIGRYRTTDAGVAIDSAGQLPTGEAFSGAKQLATLVAQSPEFARCVTRKLYTYALGRPPSDDAGHLDGPTLESVSAAFAASGFAWRELVTGIALGATFTSRRGEPVGGMP